MRCYYNIILVILVTLHCCSCQYDALSGDQLWEIEGEVGHVSTMLQKRGLVDIFDESGDRKIIRVSPKHLAEVRLNLLKNNLSYKSLVEDLAVYLKEKDKMPTIRQSAACTDTSCPKPLSDAYMTLDQIEWYLKEINNTYSSRLSVTSIGKSIEGRDIWQVHIKPMNCSLGGAVWFEAGIHAREWISPAVALNMIPMLLEDCSRIGRLDIFIVPVANPDGYLYSWTTNRLWRKNRRMHPNQTADSICNGVDLNRNWDHLFGVHASSSICSEVYHGAAGFSEPETHALKEAMIAVSQRYDLLMSMAIHSYSQLLLYPWGSSSEEAPDTQDMINRGNLWASGAKKKYGTVYRVLNAATGLYFASGTTDDWAKGVLNVKYSYTLELRDTGTQGFVLSPDQIKPCSEEVWDGMKILLKIIGPGKYAYL